MILNSPINLGTKYCSTWFRFWLPTVHRYPDPPGFMNWCGDSLCKEKTVTTKCCCCAKKKKGVLDRRFHHTIAWFTTQKMKVAPLGSVFLATKRADLAAYWKSLFPRNSAEFATLSWWSNALKETVLKTQHQQVVLAQLILGERTHILTRTSRLARRNGKWSCLGGPSRHACCHKPEIAWIKLRKIRQPPDWTRSSTLIPLTRLPIPPVPAVSKS